MEPKDMDTIADAIEAAVTVGPDAVAAEVPVSDEAPESEAPEGEEPEVEQEDGSAAEAKDGEEGGTEDVKTKPTEPSEQPEETPEETDSALEGLDPNISARTKERILHLVKTAKDLTGERDQFKQKSEQLDEQLRGISQTFEQTKASPHELQGMVEYLTLANSSDPQKIREALAQTQAEMQRLSLMLGPSADFDPLGAFPDLRQQVEDGGMTQEQALRYASASIAQLQQARAVRYDQAAAQQANQQAAINQGINDGAQAVMAAVQAVKGDPDHGERMQLLRDDLAESIASTLPPQQWAAEFKRRYDAAGALIKKAGALRPRSPNPLSGTSAGTSKAKARTPRNTMEAIDAALAQ